MGEPTTAHAPDSSTTAIVGTETSSCLQIGRAILTRNALFLPADATEEECEIVVHATSWMDEASPWWRADAIRQAEALHGEKYAQWVDILGASEGYLRNLVWVANVFADVNDRHPHLPFKHHQEVASVESREERLRLLAKAYELGWSAQRLRDEVGGMRFKANVEAQKNLGRGAWKIDRLPDWEQYIGVKGEIVYDGEEFWLQHAGGMLLICPAAHRPATHP